MQTPLTLWRFSSVPPCFGAVRQLCGTSGLSSPAFFALAALVVYRLVKDRISIHARASGGLRWLRLRNTISRRT